MNHFTVIVVMIDITRNRYKRGKLIIECKLLIAMIKKKEIMKNDQ